MSYSRSTASRLMKTFREYGPILSSPVGEGAKWCIDATFELHPRTHPLWDPTRGPGSIYSGQ
nr:hypothetical protein [Desulfosporosinus sp. BICA1-9]